MTSSAHLSQAEADELPEGARVTVTWSGGNGPHGYVIAVDRYGRRYVWDGTTEALRYYNPLRFVGRERFHTRVTLNPQEPTP